MSEKLWKIEIYNTQHLAIQHTKNNSDDLKSYIPNIDIKDLSTAILRLQKEVADFLKVSNELIGITCDGIISEVENLSMTRF